MGSISPSFIVPSSQVGHKRSQVITSVSPSEMTKVDLNISVCDKSHVYWIYSTEACRQWSMTEESQSDLFLWCSCQNSPSLQSIILPLRRDRRPSIEHGCNGTPGSTASPGCSPSPHSPAVQEEVVSSSPWAPSVSGWSSSSLRMTFQCSFEDTLV